MFDPKTYFTDVASKHKEILHTDGKKKFYVTEDNSDFFDLITQTTGIKGPFLVLMNTSGKLTGDLDNFIDSPYVVLFVMQYVDSTKPSQMDERIQQCKQIGKEILAKMLHDKFNQENGLDYMDFSQIDYRKAGPIGNYAGYYFGFVIPDDAGLEYDANKWQ